MKRKSFLVLAAFMVVWFGGWAFFQRHDPWMPYGVGTAAAIILFILALFSFPKMTNFFADNERLLKPLGYSLAALGFSAIMVPLLVGIVRPLMLDEFLAEINYQVWLISCGVAALIGYLVGSAAKSAKKYIPLRDDPRPELTPDRIEFSWFREAIASNRYVLNHFAAFLKIAGPWIVIAVFVPLIIFQTVALNDGATSNIGEPARAIPAMHLISWGLLASFFEWFTASVAVVAWVRFVVQGDYPKTLIALPERTSWLLLFAVFIFNSMTSRLARMVLPDTATLAAHLGMSKQVAAAVLGVTIQLLALWVVALLAVPHVGRIIGGHSAPSLADTRWRGLGRNFGSGFIVALAPAQTASYALNWLSQRYFDPSISVQQLIYIAPGLFWFLSVTAGATYVARGYKAAKTSSSDGPVKFAPQTNG